VAKQKNLIIVESPAKARTLEKFLGKDFKVVACGGHVRDLPSQRLGVDVEKAFMPTYVTVKGKAPMIKSLKEAAEHASVIYLAPDPDREGEAIAWHLKNVLGEKVKVKRIEFHEITKSAVQEAVKHPRTIDLNRVDAQQARRILDRLVGYKISPILWQKIRKGLSAGRVQSVALRLICDREAQIRGFKPEEYWNIVASLMQGNSGKSFSAKFVGKGGEKIKVVNQKQAEQIVAAAKTVPFVVAEVTKKEQRRYPAPPFITSTLQQEAARKFGFSAKKTMAVAQTLYEGVEVKGEGRVGLISYMRTDSFRLSTLALDEVRKFIASSFGTAYLPPKPNFYKKKKQAQDAHEAIRPTSTLRTPDQIKSDLTPEQYKLYLLIWNRFVACQMLPAILDQTAVDIEAAPYSFRATGSVIMFDGFIILYIEGKDEEESQDEGEGGVLPELTKGEALTLKEIIPTQHFTQPPARFTEATLVKELEQKEIGRPSTYAPIMATLDERGYVEKENRFLRPTELGELINSQMVKHFPEIVDVSFTARMEEELDEILEGTVKWQKMLAEFYRPFSRHLEKAKVEMKKIKSEQKLEELCPNCGKHLMVREGRFGKFIACSGFPKCRYTRHLEEKGKGAGKGKGGEGEGAEEQGKEQGKGQGEGKGMEPSPVCEKCGKPMIKKFSRFGAFWACSGYPECKNIKSITKEIGVACPACGGKLIERRSKRRKVFYGCSNYPKCKFALWDKPTGEKCPKCTSLLVEKHFRNKPPLKKCSNKECDYQIEMPAPKGEPHA
jgi:DNA topoisomerase-1